MGVLLRMRNHFQQNSHIIYRVVYDLRFLIAGFLVTGYGVGKIVSASQKSKLYLIEGCILIFEYLTRHWLDLVPVWRLPRRVGKLVENIGLCEQILCVAITWMLEEEFSLFPKLYSFGSDLFRSRLFGKNTTRNAGMILIGARFFSRIVCWKANHSIALEWKKKLIGARFSSRIVCWKANPSIALWIASQSLVKHKIRGSCYKSRSEKFSAV